MKARPNKLDAHAAFLDELDAGHATLAAMQAQLKERGCAASLPALSRFLSSRREAAMRERILSQITSGRQHCDAVEQQLDRNPAPELKTLMELHRVLILQLSTQAGTDPELLEMVTSAMKPVMEFAKLGIKQQELALDQKRFQRECGELFLKWAEDQRAREIAASPATNAAKIEQLGALMFGEDWKP